MATMVNKKLFDVTFRELSLNCINDCDECLYEGNSICENLVMTPKDIEEHSSDINTDVEIMEVD